METASSSPRLFDPDVIALVQAHGLSRDPYEIVREKVDELLRKFACLGGDDMVDALQRIRVIASIAGFTVQPIDLAGARQFSGRAAMVVPSTDSSKRGVILYDPRLPTARVVFSIAHEIIHSFFPNSRRGVQFRAVVMPSSRPGRQLEMLCEFGAALLTMPESAFIASVKRNGFGLAFVSTVAAEFGTSFEATLYRMAQTASIPAAAAKFCYRFAKKDLAVAPASGSLFPMPSREIAQPRYRRQSFHPSRPYPSAFLIPFNKSVRDGSCIYVAAKRPGFQRAHEDLPGRDRGPRVRSLVEAIAAPFQPEDRDRNWPDVLVLIQLITT